MPRRRPLRPLAAALCLLTLAPLSAFADNTTPTWVPTRVTAPESVDELRSLQAAVKTVVDKVTPATVGIWILGSDGFHVQGAGSGVIVSPDGLILTAAHVIAPSGRGSAGKDQSADRYVLVELYDGTKVKAKILGRNPDADSGMVKITGEVPKSARWPGAKDGKWPFAEVADPSPPKPGLWVVTLGHPGAPKRDRRAPVRVGQLQKQQIAGKVMVSDCTLVGGDSGGPLFDLTGKVIGIHSRIGMTLGQNIHIPVKAFKDEWTDLAAGKLLLGKIRPYLGVVLNREGNEEPRILVIKDGSPAAKAGLKAGDLILKMDGDEVESSEDVDNTIQRATPGDKLKLEVRRADEVVELTVTLGRFPDGDEGGKKDKKDDAKGQEKDKK